jgi:hypothetical protein
MERVHGIRAAAPTPITARAAISPSVEPENAAKADPAPKTTKPPIKTHLRPTRSPREPRLSKRPANTTAYASTIHCNSVVVAWRLRTIDGSATLRMVLSRLISRSVTHKTDSVAQRQRPPDRPATDNAEGIDLVVLTETTITPDYEACLRVEAGISPFHFRDPEEGRPT